MAAASIASSVGAPIMAKKGKVGTLDAVSQYVKNKLPQTGFFSTLDELIGSAPFEKAPLDQWRNYLQPGRVLEREGIRFPLKKEELDYSGLGEDFSGALAIHENQNIPISKEKLRGIIQNRRPDFRLRVGIPSDVDRIDVLPERFPEEARINDLEENGRDAPSMDWNKYGDYAHEHDPSQYEESAIRSTDFTPYGTHFGPDVISHSRTTIQPTVPEKIEGGDFSEYTKQRLMRLIEEIQSDRHQAAAERPMFAASITAPTEYGPRRGYLTSKEERELSQLERYLGGGKDLDTPEGRSAFSRWNELKKRIPDAPFKDPADYANLEMKNQLLNAAKQGQDYLGLIRGSDVSDRFSHGPDERAGTAYTYDKIYQSVLKKLANQYGIEVRDVPTTLRPSIDVATPSMRSMNSETATDYLHHNLEMIGEDDDEGRDQAWHNLHDFVNELEERVPDNPELESARQLLGRLEDAYSSRSNPTQAHESRAVQQNWSLLSGALNRLHNQYATSIKREKASESAPKTFPSMVLTPEIREKILKAGVPIWGLSAMTAGTLAGLGANEGDQGFADGGIARLRQLAENVGTKDTIDRRKRILSGWASQMYGVNPETGNVEFLGGASLLPRLRSLDEIRARAKHYAQTGEVPEDTARPGLIDEIQSMFLGTNKSHAADERLATLKNRIRQEMDVAEPTGFGQEFDESLGTMLGQLPVPLKGASSAKGPLLQKLRNLVKTLPEWITPTVEPKIANYLTGAGVGAGIGAIADSGQEREREQRQGDDFLASWNEHHPDEVTMAEGGDPRDFTNRYNTSLTPEQEQAFQVWAGSLGDRGSSYDYDMRGAFLAHAGQADNGHFPDTFKKPNHPTFSTQSQYNGKDGYSGGEWSQEPDGSWSFIPSSSILDLHDPSELQDYFARVEAGNKLLMPVRSKGHGPVRQRKAEGGAVEVTKPLRATFDLWQQRLAELSSTLPGFPTDGI